MLITTNWNCTGSGIMLNVVFWPMRFNDFHILLWKFAKTRGEAAFELKVLCVSNRAKSFTESLSLKCEKCFSPTIIISLLLPSARTMILTSPTITISLCFRVIEKGKELEQKISKVSQKKPINIQNLSTFS